jgi:hypothetical protein
MALQVTIYDGNTDTYSVLVLFRMDGKKLKADWRPDSEWFRKDLEKHGIVTGEGKFFPKDGKRFFDNLQLAFSRSSFIQVKPLSRFADSDFEFMTVYDKDGNPIPTE